jgi:tRNA modification GTPase
MAVVFHGPRSLTGEDVAELHCHGGIYLVRRVIGLALDLGARMAEPGEFTRRAFLNGRIDLTAAEAIADLVDARGDRALALALSQMAGALAERVTALRAGLIAIRANLEAEIDFSDEDIALPPRAGMIARLERVLADVATLRDSFERGRLTRSGARAAIIGKPNTGKSSILNLMLGAERAIVTSIPGTTRDVIEESISIGGYPVVIQDTAGMRETEDPIERIGVSRSIDRAAEADLLIAVFDSARPLDSDDQAVAAIMAKQPAVAVLNKSDLPAVVDAPALAGIGIGAPVVGLSAITGSGIENLLKEISARIEKLAEGATDGAGIAISRERHRAALDHAASALNAAIGSARAGMPPEIIAVDVVLAGDWLGAITGDVSTEDVLDALFREFCIGK